MDVSEHYDTQARGARVPRSQFTPSAPGRVGDAADRAVVPAAHREPRRAVRRAAPASRWPRGSSSASRSCARTCSRTGPLGEPRCRVNIGIVCYASVGGSGDRRDRAREGAGRARARRPRPQQPTRRSGSAAYQPGLTFHRVSTPAYPLFREPQYLLSLANKIVQVSRESSSTSSTRTTRCRTRPPPTWRGRFCGAAAGSRAEGDHDAARHRHHAGRQRSARTRRRWRSRSSSRTA